MVKRSSLVNPDLFHRVWHCLIKARLGGRGDFPILISSRQWRHFKFHKTQIKQSFNVTHLKPTSLAKILKKCQSKMGSIIIIGNCDAIKVTFQCRLSVCSSILAFLLFSNRIQLYFLKWPNFIARRPLHRRWMIKINALKLQINQAYKAFKLGNSVGFSVVSYLQRTRLQLI